MSSSKFDAAVSYVQGLPPKGEVQPSRQAQLKFYALYKQGTEGPNTTVAPSRLNIIARAKWYAVYYSSYVSQLHDTRDAWKKLEKMTKEEARLAYIAELTIMDGTWLKKSKL
jgi:diazepam-binding inhibitor (GABA receptor modulating acyl-CoA-binding protein)